MPLCGEAGEFRYGDPTENRGRTRANVAPNTSVSLSVAAGILAPCEPYAGVRGGLGGSGEAAGLDDQRRRRSASGTLRRKFRKIETVFPEQ